jgi:hypothetical protein
LLRAQASSLDKSGAVLAIAGQQVKSNRASRSWLPALQRLRLVMIASPTHGSGTLRSSMRQRSLLRPGAGFQGLQTLLMRQGVLALPFGIEALTRVLRALSG